MSLELLRKAQTIVAAPEPVKSACNVRISFMANILRSWMEQGQAPAAGIDSMWATLEAEAAHMEKFLEPAQAATMEDSARAQNLFADGVSCHYQACQALAQALRDVNPQALEQVCSLLDQGDRLIEQSETSIQLLAA